MMESSLLELEFKELVLKNFRKFDDKRFSFTHITHIFGDNEEGKSTIAEGIAFALYGVTIYGSNHTDPLVKIGSEGPTEAELTFSVDGKKRVIQRIKKEEKTEVFLDGNKTSQKQFQEKLLRRLSPKQFLMGFYPLFWTALTTDELRKLFISLTVPPSREEVLEKLGAPERRVLGDTSILDQAKLKQEYADQDEKKKGLSSQVELLKNQIAEKSSPAPSGESQEIITGLKGKLKTLQLQKEELEKSIGNPPVAPPYTNLMAITEEINKSRREYAKTKPPEFKPGDKCPTCGQAVTDAALEQLRASYAGLRKKIENYGINLKTQLAEAEKKNAEQKKKYDKEFAAWQAKHTELNKLNEEILQLNNQIAASAVSTAKEKDKQQLEADLREKEAKIAELDKDLASRRNVLGTLNAFHKKMIEMQTAGLTKYLTDVSIKLFEPVKSTGEMAETFKLLYKNKPAQFLSFSEKIRTGLELGNMFRHLTGVNIPSFLDNHESIGYPKEYDVQSFYAWFVLKRELQMVDPTADQAQYYVEGDGKEMKNNEENDVPLDTHEERIAS